MLTEKISLVSLGDSIKAWLYLPEGSGPFPVLLISHGAGEHHGNYQELTDYLAERGIATFIPDMHGHGESEGERFHVRMEQWVPDLNAAVDFLSHDPRIHPDKICALGLSSGGTAILEAALTDHRFRALIALDATVRTSLPVVFNLMLRLCILLGSLKKRFCGEDLRWPLAKLIGKIQLASDPEVDKRLALDPRTLKSTLAFPFPGAKEAFYVDTIRRMDRLTVPTLIVWGEEDQLDTPATAHLLFKKLRCEKELHILAGNGHRVRVFQLTSDWILKHTATAQPDLMLIEGKAATRFTRAEKEKLLLPFVRQHGTQALSYATMQEGMNYYITPKGFIAYTTVVHPVFGPQGRSITLEDPLCSKEDMTEMIRGFLEWNPRACFFVISEECAALVRPFGFKANCIGPEPELPIQTYNTEGNWKELDLIKRARNEAKRRGVSIREVPLETIPLEQLKHASSTWMQTKILSTREIWIYARRPVFAAEPDVRKFLAFDKEGKVIGFVFYDPMYREGKIVGYAANTVRCDEMNFGRLATAIHMEAIEVFRQEGLEFLNLCLAPFVKLDQGKFNDDVLSKFYFELCERFGNDIYNFRGLAFHKSKYRGKEKFIYFATNNPLPANDVYLAYLSAGIATSYFKSSFDLIKGITKGLWQMAVPPSKNHSHETKTQPDSAST
jgi:alpha-beta hydrolase superfamily lysophospholipase